jgi:predicted ATPase with chaperone activity
MTPRFKKYCELDVVGNRMLELVTDRFGFSARTYTRVLKVARPLPIWTAAQTFMNSLSLRRFSIGVWIGNRRKFNKPSIHFK